MRGCINKGLKKVRWEKFARCSGLSTICCEVIVFFSVHCRRRVYLISMNFKLIENECSACQIKCSSSFIRA